MILSTLQIQLDPPLENVMAHIRYDEPPVVLDNGDVDGDWDERKTNAAGYTAFLSVEPRPVYVLVRAAGYKDVLANDGQPIQMPHDLPVTVPLTRAGQEKGFLHTKPGDMDFYDDQDRPWLFAGIAAHLLLNLVVKGVDIRPLLQEWLEVGANTTVVIGLHASPWKDAHGYRLDPTADPAHFFDCLARLFDVHAEMGMRCLFHVFADLQYMAPRFDHRGHFARSRDVMRGRANVFASKGNESNVNGWREDDYNFGTMDGVLCTQGSQGENNNPHVPYLDLCLYEVTRGRKRLYDNGAGMRQLFDGDFEGPATQRPTLSIEPTAFNDVSPDHAGDTRETNWKVALAMGVNISANCAGGALTMSKPMEAMPMTDADKVIARAWFRGLRAGFVR